MALPEKSIKQGLVVSIVVLALSSFVVGFAACGAICKYSHSDTNREEGGR